MEELENEYSSLMAERAEILKEINGNSFWRSPIRVIKAIHRLQGNFVQRQFVAAQIERLKK